MIDLNEQLTPEEYDLLVALTEKANRLTLDRLPDYVKATGQLGPGRWHQVDHIEYKSRDRTGRDALGRYDIVIQYTDFDRDTYEVYLPSSILWDPAGAIGRTIDVIEAERAEQARIDREVEEERKRKAEEAERAQAARLARKYGYVKR